MRCVSMLLCLAVLIVSFQALPGPGHARTADAISKEFKFENLPPEQQQQVQASQEAQEGDGASPTADDLAETNVTLVMAQIIKEAVVMISLAVMAVISLYFVLSTLYRRNSSSRDIIGGSGLVVIVYGTIILTLTVSTEQQLTAAAGILGAIAGYLFGTSQRSEATHVPGGQGGSAPAPVNPVPANPGSANPGPSNPGSSNPSPAGTP